MKHPERPLRLNLGCAARPLAGYVNIDLDTIETIRGRYPNLELPANTEIFQYNIFDLPFDDGTVDEVRADSMLEHLSFAEEPKFFYEMKRVLRPGGILHLSLPDFEKLVELWLAAKDDWKDFYRNDPEAIASQHWFGNYSYGFDNRWGYLTASLFGPQNSPGQFHKNCYTTGKIRAILRVLGFDEISITPFRWKGDRDHMLDVIAKKR